MPRSFKLLETLGEGAFGAVHLAEVRDDDDFVQTLAVKWLHPRWSADADLAGRLRDEARLLALLNHEHIVRVHGLTRLEGRLAILMEPVDGADLSRLDGQPMPPRAALEAVADVAEALEAAWNTTPAGTDEPLRVVHRDIKPSNVMVTGRGRVKVMDFGVARARFDAREAHTQSQQFGTARYMAPERWLDGVAEAPSDVFSLGITLLELLAGRPIERPRLSPGAFSSDIAEALTVVDAWPEVRGLVQVMVAYDAEDRPSAAKVAIECRDIASRIEGASLRDWAETWVDEHRGHSTSDGTIVPEDASAETFQVLPSVQQRTADTSGLTAPLTASSPLAPGVGGLVLGIAGTLLVIAGVVWLVPGPGEQPAADAVADQAPAPEPLLETPQGTPPEADEASTPAPTLDPEPIVPPPSTAPVTAPVRQPEAPPPAEAAPDPPPPEPEPEVTLTVSAGPGLDMDLAGLGAIRNRVGKLVPTGFYTLTVSGAGEPFQCTLDVDSSVTRYSVDGARRTCERQ